MYKWAQASDTPVYRVWDTDDGDTIDEYIKALPADPATVQIGKRMYMRAGAGYDIETTRLHKYAYTYHHQLAIGDMIILIRTWDQYEKLITRLNAWLHARKLRLIIWVANLSHEWMFIQYRHTWSSVFAKQALQPLKCCTKSIEYREALSISGQGGLQNLAKCYTKTKKAKGDLDYSKLRNTYTKLYKVEKGYCIADVAILSEWGEYLISTYIKKDGDRIPMTQTGICRKAVQDALEATGKADQIRQKIREIFPKTEDAYNFTMTYLFRGGYTHANLYWASNDDINQVIPNVIGWDITSSYPSSMLHCPMPYQRFIQIHDLQTDGKRITDPRLNLYDDALIITIRFRGLYQTTLHSIESDHKILPSMPQEGIHLDNGRLICAEDMTVCLTELDYMVYEMYYDWESIEIINAFVSRKGMLPEYLTQPLLDAYVAKYQMKKAHKDHTPEYYNAKAMVNSFYGMTVQRLNMDRWVYVQPDTKVPWIQKHSTKPYWRMTKEQYLSCYWGIWITSWSRYKLLQTVKKLDPDRQHFNVIYCDTDSIYMLDTPRNRQIMKEVNAEIHLKNKDLPPECHDLGEFDMIDHGAHYRFKTLGAKRYIKEHNGIAEITVAGMRKGSYERHYGSETPPEDAEYIIVRLEDPENPERKKEYYIDKDTLFRGFRPSLVLDVDVADKIIPCRHHTPYSADIDGVVMQELSGIALVPTTFKMKMSDYYKSLITEYKLYSRHPVDSNNPLPDIGLEMIEEIDDSEFFEELPDGSIILGGVFG